MGLGNNFSRVEHHQRVPTDGISSTLSREVTKKEMNSVNNHLNLANKPVNSIHNKMNLIKRRRKALTSPIDIKSMSEYSLLSKKLSDEIELRDRASRLNTIQYNSKKNSEFEKKNQSLNNVKLSNNVQSVMFPIDAVKTSRSLWFHNSDAYEDLSEPDRKSRCDTRVANRCDREKCSRSLESICSDYSSENVSELTSSSDDSEGHSTSHDSSYESPDWCSSSQPTGDKILVKKAGDKGSVSRWRVRDAGLVTMSLDADKLRHVTSLNVSRNHLKSLDVSSLASLRVLICPHNGLTHLAVHGALLTHLDAAHNELTTLVTRYPPRQLIDFNMTSNHLVELPHWLELCGDLKVLDASRNRITKLADWIPLPNIVKLALHHNKLTHLPLTEALAKVSQAKNTSFQMGSISCSPSSSIVGSDQEAPPPPTPPRMSNLCPSKVPRNLSSAIRERNLLLTNSLQNNRQFLNKRPVPPPPRPHVGSERAPSPPPLPPPPQFLLRGDSFRPPLPRVDPPKHLPSMPPPVPALPPHLQSSNVKPFPRNSQSSGSLLQEDVEEGYYEECGKGRSADDVEYDLEVLLLHHNRLRTLPAETIKKLSKLRVLNVSNNQLVQLPCSPQRSTNSSADIVDYPAFSFSGTCETPKTMLDNLEEFYGGCNSLTSLDALDHCKQLRVLHVAYNELTAVPDRLAEYFPRLEELVVAGNHLQSLPEGVANLKCLRLLRLNCNPLSQLPHLALLPDIKVIDASHCRLGELRLSSTIAPSLAILDVAENPALSVDPQHANLCRTRGSVSVVDARRDRLCPMLQPTRQPPEVSEGNTTNIASGQLPLGGWSAGFAECIGRKGRLHCRQLRISDFSGNGRSALFGLVEEAPNTEAGMNQVDSSKGTDNSKTQTPATLERSKQASAAAAATAAAAAASVSEILAEFPEVLKEDLDTEEEHALKYAMLTVLRKQLLHGKVLPVGFCAVHLEGHTPTNGTSRTELNTMSAFKSSKHQQRDDGSSRLGLRVKAGGCGAATTMLVSRTSQPVMLTEELTKGTCKEVHLEGAGDCCQLIPEAALPDPSSTSLELTPDVQALVLASRGLWEVMEPHEVNQICLRTADPSLAARRLLTLAQSYGAQDALSIMVVAITFPETLHTQAQRGGPFEKYRTAQANNSNCKVEEVSNDMKSSESIPCRPQINSKATHEGNRGRLPKKSGNPGEKVEAQIHNEENGYKKRNHQESGFTKRDRKHITSKLDQPFENKKEPDLIVERNTSIPPEKPSRLRNTTENDRNVKNFKNLTPNELKSGSRSDFLGILDKVSNTSNLPLPNPYNPSTHDRSSPSGQSFSDLSIILGEDDTNIEERKPVWPGQLGPVAPSGPFALDLNKNDQDSTDGPIYEIRGPSSPLDRRNHPCEPGFRRDRMSVRSSADSFASNSTKTTRMGIESICSSQRSSARNASVPVFRPFYHFPSPDSIILLNKSNSGENSQTRACFSRSVNGDSSERSSFISKKMRPFQKLLRSTPSTTSKSLSALSENGGISDSEISDLSSISKLCSNLNGSDAEQVSEEQLRSFEYVLAKNAKKVYLKDLDTTSERHWRMRQRRKDLLLQQHEMERELFLRHALSVPDLVEAQRRLEECAQDSSSAGDRRSENPHHSPLDKLRSHDYEDANVRLRDGTTDSKSTTLFQRSTARKSRFGRGTVRILQHRLANASNKLNSMQKSHKHNNGNCNTVDRNFTTSSVSSPFRRYGSLQNLKCYQGRNTENSIKCKPGNFAAPFNRSGSIGSLQSLSTNGFLHHGISTEMQEKRALDSAELESRMNQYWQSNTTCF